MGAARRPQKILAPFITLSHRFPLFLEHSGPPKYDIFSSKNNQRFELKFKNFLKKRLAASRPIFQKINQQFQKNNPALRAEIQKKTLKRFFFENFH